MIVGLIGLGLSGKTTIFNAVTHGDAVVGSYQSQKDEVHRGRVFVPDERIDWLSNHYESKSTVYAEVEYIDVAGLSGKTDKAAAADIPPALKDCDELAHVVRAFEDDNVLHPKDSIDVRRDITALDEELIFADLIIVEKRLDKVSRQIKAVKDEKLKQEFEVLSKVVNILEDNKPLRDFEFSENEAKIFRGFRFLSQKPMLLIINISEEQLEELDTFKEKYADLANSTNIDFTIVCGKIEMELSQLDDDDRNSFMTDLGIKESALNLVIRKSYQLLGLISFLTSAEQETRAWTVRKGSSAPKAASVIHEDFERGFIRAEVVKYDDFYRCGTLADAKKDGLVRLEGKTYIVQDGDVILFRFNV